LVKKIKLLPDYKFTPILMLTTEAGDSMKSEGKAAGAKAWLVKPFQPAVLLAAITKLA
jgi:two-component system chemotaxis response regulator CheY